MLAYLQALFEDCIYLLQFEVQACNAMRWLALSCQVLELGRANGAEGTSSPEPDEQFAELWWVPQELSS